MFNVEQLEGGCVKHKLVLLRFFTNEPQGLKA